MPPRHNDALDARLVPYFRIASDGSIITETVLAQQIIIPPCMFDSPSISFEIVTEETSEDTFDGSSEELDNFLKEFTLKGAC